MGNFYTNITVFGADGAAVTNELRLLARQAFVADLGRTCVVYDEQCEEQDTEVLAALAEELSARLAAKSFAILNHDDDILWFQLYDRSELVAEYANRGGPRTRVRALCRALEKPGDVVAVWLILRLPFLFQVFRHQWLARRLGLPGASVGSGFKYITQGESPAGVAADRLLRVRGG